MWLQTKKLSVKSVVSHPLITVQLPSSIKSSISLEMGLHIINCDKVTKVTKLNKCKYICLSNVMNIYYSMTNCYLTNINNHGQIGSHA